VYALLLTLLILDGLVMGVVILLQSGKGGGLASMGGGMGSDTLIGGRQAANLLTKTTWVTGGLFLTLSLVLAILSSRAQRPNSILRDEFRAAPAAAPAPVQVPGATPAQPAPAPGQQQAPATTTN
jgi:preprotein translocase subunit SecG